MIRRILTVAAFGTGLSMGAGAAFAEAASPAQSAQNGHSHHHMPEAGDSAHQHDAVPATSVQVEMKAQPEMLRAGERAELVFSMKDPSGKAAGDLLAHHGRKFHVVIVSEDMDVLGHIHPEDFRDEASGDANRVFFTFPRPGNYLVAADFMTESGAHSEQFMVTVDGAASSAQSERPARTLSVPLAEGDRYVEAASFATLPSAPDYAVSLQQPEKVVAGEAASFTYHLMKGAEPLTDLRPYLEAPLHLAVVKDDLSVFIHTHGTLPGEIGADHAAGHHGHADGADHASGHHGHADGDGDRESFGPEIAANITFPEPGTYYLFAQAAHGDQLLISRVPVQVGEAVR